MIITIELIVIIALILTFVGWKLVFFIMKFIDERRYKKENDKGRPNDFEDGRTSRRIEQNSNDTSEQRGFEERGNIQTESTNSIGKNSTSTGKKLGIFRRRK